MKYCWENHPNTSCVSFHSRVPLPYCGKYTGTMGVGEGEPVPAGSPISFDESMKLRQQLHEIPGVEDITIGIDKYSISIHKAKMFSWEEIKPKFLGIIQKVICKDETFEEIADPDFLRKYIASDSGSFVCTPAATNVIQKTEQ